MPDSLLAYAGLESEAGFPQGAQDLLENGLRAMI
jgi:hypothetical protein